MAYIIPKKLIDNAKFEWEDLKGKTLKINVGYDQETGSFAVAGRDEETGKIYLLHTEIKKKPTNECPKCESLDVSTQSVDESYEQVIDVCNDCGWQSEPRSERDGL